MQLLFANNIYRRFMGSIEGSMSLELEAGIAPQDPGIEAFALNPDALLKDMLFAVAPSLSAFHSGVTQD